MDNNISTIPRNGTFRTHRNYSMFRTYLRFLPSDTRGCCWAVKQRISLGWSNTTGEKSLALWMLVKMLVTIGWWQNRLGIPPTSPTFTQWFFAWNKYAVEDCFKRKTLEGSMIPFYIYPSSFVRIIIMFVSTLLPGVCCHSCQVFVSVYNRPIVSLHVSS